MKILALQLKRIGDLILTTPALSAVRKLWPEARITLIVADGCGELLPAIGGIDHALVFRCRATNAALWKHVLAGEFDLCLDFTGSDRSALLAAASRAKDRVTFEWVKKSRLRALAFTRFVDSPVRERHTADHYLDLVADAAKDATRVEFFSAANTPQPQLAMPQSARERARSAVGGKRFATIHPGTARAEKLWVAERWAELIVHLRERHGLECVITGGTDEAERAHISTIQSALAKPALDLAGKIDLLTFAAVIECAAICVSCDTAAVHLAAAFQRPQVALFGPTNPFHWRPRHARAVVISAASPDAPLTEFDPRMRGAPMERISTAVVVRAADALLWAGSEQ